MIRHPIVHFYTDEGRVLCKATFPRMHVSFYREDVTCLDCKRLLPRPS